MRAWLLKRYGKFVFVKVLEFQKSGRPHLHVLLKFDKLPKYVTDEGYHRDGISHKDLSEIWQKYGGGEVVYIQECNSSFKGLAYVLKYVNKTMSSVKSYVELFAALLFASNRRLFSMSRNLLALVGFKGADKEEGWSY